MASSRLFLSIFLVITTGFAMFAMFFGSGNLVFPILLGEIVAEHYLWGVIGLTLTAVIVPFLGFYGISLFNADYEKFFHRLGGHADFILPLLILALIGPFGVIPRCITVAYGSFLLLFPDMSQTLFAIGMTLILFLLILDPHKIVPIIGTVLTPVLLISLLMIIVYGLAGTDNLSSITTVNDSTALSAFFSGITQGYHTLDLMAAFFFSVVVIQYIGYTLHRYNIDKKQYNKFVWGAMVCGMGMLAFIYVTFVYLGALYAQILDPAHPESSIVLIAHHVLGNLASPIVVIAVVLTTLTTATALTSVSSNFLHRRIFLKKLPPLAASAIILGLSFLVSNLKFSGIAAFLGPVLQILYPSLIVLTIVNIAYKWWRFSWIKLPFYTVLGLSLIGTIAPSLNFL